MTEFETEVLRELRRIRELLERRDADEPNLLAAIHSATRGAAFTVSELLAHAALPANGDLQAALEGEIGSVNSRRLGNFLSSIAGKPTGGFIVEAIGKEHSAVIWRVRACSNELPLPVVQRKNAAMLSPSLSEGKRKCG